MVGKADTTRRLVAAIALAAALAICAAQPVLAFDGRSPDTRDAQAASVATAIDVRTPDTRLAALEATDASIAAGARDAVTRVAPPAAITSTAQETSSGFDWGDFGLGLGAALGSVLVVALLAAVALASRQRRRGSTRPAMS
jgi:hypothetical protein